MNSYVGANDKNAHQGNIAGRGFAELGHKVPHYGE
jgi:hypothetical protein